MVTVDVSEKRVIGSLLLLLGLTFAIVGLYSGHLDHILRLVKDVFETAVAGWP
jgi:hypothetical protein